MTFPDYILKDDMDLWFKECRLAGCDIVRTAREVWINELAINDFSYVLRTDGHWGKVPLNGSLRMDEAVEAADAYRIPG